MSTQENKSEAIAVELMQTTSSALEQMERAQIDVQISTAKRYPRSMELFKRRALEMVSLDEETAASCIYRRPVGKKNVNGKWVEEFAEGESVRMAEIVASSFGNIRVSAKIVEQTERYVKCVGMAHDLESNYASQAETMEATVKRDGSPYSENMRAVVAKACLSKAWRDALFRVVPKSLCKTISDTARKVAIGDSTTLEKRRSKVAEWVSKCGIAPERVWAVLGVKGPADLTLEHLETLTGVRTAIKDGDVTLDAAFPETKFESKKVDPPAGAPTNPKVLAETDAGTQKPTPSKTGDDKEEGSMGLGPDPATKTQSPAEAAKVETKAPEAKTEPTTATASTLKSGRRAWNSAADKPALKKLLADNGCTEAQLGQLLNAQGVSGMITIETAEGACSVKLARILDNFQKYLPDIKNQPGKSAI